MVQKKQESTTSSSVCSFTYTAHLFACFTLLASVARSTAFICSLARSLTHFQARGNVSDKMLGHQAVLNHSELLLSLSYKQKSIWLYGHRLFTDEYTVNMSLMIRDNRAITSMGGFTMSTFALDRFCPVLNENANTLWARIEKNTD